MRSTLSLLLGLALTTSLATGCGIGEDEFVYEEGHLFAEDYLTSYQELAGFGCAKSPTHAGDYVRVLVSADAMPIFDGEEIPDGAVIVKPQYFDDACTEFKAVTSMKKDSTVESGWQWQRASKGGTIEDTGQVDYCINCHAGCAMQGGVCAEKE